jgi:hypothetical protein
VQVQMQAFGTKSESLRKAIRQDLDRGLHPDLYVDQGKNADRAPGWTKIKARGVRGVINIEWDSNQRMLTARAIAQKGNYPHELLGIFVAYLVEKHRKRVAAINIQLA